MWTDVNKNVEKTRNVNKHNRIGKHVGNWACSSYRGKKADYHESLQQLYKIRNNYQ